MKKNLIILILPLVGLLFFGSHAGAAENPTISTSTLPSGVIAVNYSATVSGSGSLGDYSWRISTGSLPNGLQLTQQTNCNTSPCQMPMTISGTPTKIGDFAFTVELSSFYQDSILTVSKQFTIKITTGVIDAAPLVITTTSLPSGMVWVPYRATIAATGGSGLYTWSIKSGTLPAGVSMSNSYTCTTSLCLMPATISGTPTVNGNFPFTIEVSAKASADGPVVTASKDLTLTIISNALTISTTSPLPSGTVGSFYNTDVSSIGGNGALTWYLISGSLPNGLGLSYTSNCLSCQSPITISGTPVFPGISTFTLKVGTVTPEDVPVSKEFSITIAPSAAPSNNVSSPPSTILPVDGSLILDNGAIYIIENSLKRPIVSMGVFSGLGYKLSQVIAQDISAVNSGESILSSGMRHTRGALIIFNGEIYFMGKDLRYPYPSAEVFLSWGAKFENVISANSFDLSIPISPVVQKKQ